MNLKKLLVTFSHSLFWQISCFLLVVTAFAFGALFLVLQISEDSTGKGSAINVSGSLRMQSYVLALTVARSSEDTEVVRSKDIKAAIAEFERRLNLPGLTQAIPEESDNELRKSYDLISFDFYSKIKPMALETIQQPQKIHEFLKRFLSSSLSSTRLFLTWKRISNQKAISSTPASLPSCFWPSSFTSVYAISCVTHCLNP